MDNEHFCANLGNVSSGVLAAEEKQVMKQFMKLILDVYLVW